MQANEEHSSLSRFFLRHYVLGITVLAVAVTFIAYKLGTSGLIAHSAELSVLTTDTTVAANPPNAILLDQQISTLRFLVIGTAAGIVALCLLYFRVVLARADQTQMTLRKEIENYAENLEAMVAARTKELSDEKNKLQVILNHVPSAFVLVDRHLRIKIASAALRELSGKSLAEVMSQPCYRVICKRKKPVGMCPTRRALKSHRIENSNLILEHNGTIRQVEHVREVIGPGYGEALIQKLKILQPAWAARTVKRSDPEDQTGYP